MKSHSHNSSEQNTPTGSEKQPDVLRFVSSTLSTVRLPDKVRNLTRAFYIHSDIFLWKFMEIQLSTPIFTPDHEACHAA